MRIGLVTGEYPPMQGGVGAYTHILARTLAAQGHTVGVLTDRRAESGGDGVRVDAQIDRWNIGSLHTLATWAQAYDVIGVQYQTAAYAMSPWIHFIPDRVRGKVVTTFHDLRVPYLFPKAGGLRDGMVMHTARESAGAVVTNHEDFAALTRVAHKALIPIGSNITAAVAPADRARLRARLGADDAAFVVAYFGFLNASKGADLLVAAAAALRHGGVPLRLVLIGGRTGASDPTNAATAAALDAQIAASGLTEVVYQTGYVAEADAAGWLAAADAVALPFRDGASYRRGTLMAALAYGCAIVTTAPTVAIAAFRDTDNLLLVERGSVEALAAGLQRLYAQPELRLRLRAGALALAHTFGWTQIAAEYAAFCARVTGAR